VLLIGIEYSGPEFVGVTVACHTSYASSNYTMENGLGLDWRDVK
jgi:hypothetical protein